MKTSISEHSIEFFYHENVLFVRDSKFGTAMRNFIEISKDLPEKRFVLISLDKEQEFGEKYYLVDMTATNPEHIITTRSDWNYQIGIDIMVDVFKDFFATVDRQNARK